MDTIGNNFAVFVSPKSAEYTMIDGIFTEKKYKTIEIQLDNCRFLLSS
jgi:hypothetical protein